MDGHNIRARWYCQCIWQRSHALLLRETRVPAVARFYHWWINIRLDNAFIGRLPNDEEYMYVPSYLWQPLVVHWVTKIPIQSAAILVCRSKRQDGYSSCESKYYGPSRCKISENHSQCPFSSCTKRAHLRVLISSKTGQLTLSICLVCHLPPFSLPSCSQWIASSHT